MTEQITPLFKMTICNCNNNNVKMTEFDSLDLLHCKINKDKPEA